MLDRTPATIHHHLRKLADIGLVRSEKQQYYRYFSLQREQWGQLHNWIKQSLQFNQQLEEYEQSFRQGVFATAFREGNFQGFPPQQRDRDLLHRFFLGHLKRKQSYTRMELTHIYSEYTDDVDRIIRPLIKAGLLRRSRNDYRISDSPSSRKNLK